MDNNLLLLQKRAALINELHLRIKLANKLSRLREKRAWVAQAIGGTAGGVYGGYKGYQLGDAYANQWLGKDETGWNRVGKNLIRFTSTVLGGTAGALAGIGASFIPGGYLLMGSSLAFPALKSGNDMLNNHIADVNSSAGFSNNHIKSYMANLNGINYKRNYYDYNSNYKFSPNATGHYASTKPTLNNNNYTTPSYMSWQPST